MAKNVIDLFKAKPEAGKKRKSRRKKQVFWQLVSECEETGPPDLDLLTKVIRDLQAFHLKDTDILAVYLYRKKVEG